MSRIIIWGLSSSCCSHPGFPLHRNLPEALVLLIHLGHVDVLMRAEFEGPEGPG